MASFNGVKPGSNIETTLSDKYIPEEEKEDKVETHNRRESNGIGRAYA